MLSNTCKYAVRAVIYLAMNEEEGKKIGIKQISKDLDIPAPFLGKILQTLAKHKLLSSTKGPHGGFSLGRNPNDITLLDIVEIIDGNEFFNQCLIGLEICHYSPYHEKDCPFHPKSGPIRSTLYKLFKEQTVGELAESFKKTGKEFHL